MDSNDSPVPNDGFNLKTISKSGQPPRSRFEDANHTYDIVRKLMDDNKDREFEDTNIQSMFDGNPPYNSSKLKIAGQSRRANFNTRESKAQASAAAAPYYDLFSSGKHYALIESDCDEAAKREEYSGIMTEEFDDLLDNYKPFNFTVWTMINDFIRFGKGILMWENTYDWRMKRIAHYRVLVPNSTECETEDEFEMFAVIQDMAVHKLYNRIRSESHAASQGYNIKNCREAIRAASPRQIVNDQEMIELQNQIRDHDMSESMKMNSIHVAHVYVREFSNKWSHFIIERERANSDRGYLYRKIDKFDDASQIIAPFFFEVISGSWHGATGLGKDIYSPMILKSRLRCSMMDATFLRLGITLQAKTASAEQKTGILHFGGGYHVIGSDFDVQQSTVLGDIVSAVEMNRDLDSMLESNTGIYRPRLDPKPGNPMTASEFQQRMQMATVLGNSAVDRFYLQCDPMYQEIHRRVTSPNLTAIDGPGAKMALKFQENCAKRGVSLKELRKIKSVKADRNMGNGSTANRQQSLAALAPFSPGWPEEGRSNFNDDVISIYSNEGKVDRYNPKPKENPMPSDQQVEALQCVAAMKVGVPIPPSSSQNPVIYAQTYLKSASEALASIPQGGNPGEVLRFLEIIGPVIAAHLQRIAQDPARKAAYDTLLKQFKELSSNTDELKSIIEQQQKQQEQQQEEMAAAQQQAQSIQQGTDPGAVIDSAKAQHKMQLDEVKTNAKLDLNRRKTAQDMSLADIETAAKLRRDAVVAAAQASAAKSKSNGE